jgi:ABC-2 type transport system permease protein
MLRRLFALILKELLASWRDKRTRTILMVIPVAELLLFSFAATQDVRNVPIGILNLDQGAYSREIMARLQGSPTFSRIETLRSQSELDRAVTGRNILMAVQFPSDFSRRIVAGDPAAVQLILDGRRSNSAQILVAYISRIVSDYDVEIERIRGHPHAESIILTRTWFNQNLEPMWSTLPGLFAVLTTMVGILVSAMAVARERELGTFEQLLVAPLSAFEILAGKTGGALLIGTAMSSTMALAGTLVLGVPFEGSTILLLISIVVFLASVIGVGLFVSSLCSTQQQAIIGCYLFMAPAIMLSGYASPVENMPDWLQMASLANPVRHFIVISRGIFLKGLPMNVVVDHLWPMALIAVVTLSAAASMFRSKFS